MPSRGEGIARIGERREGYLESSWAAIDLSTKSFIYATNNTRHADSPEVGWAVPTNPMFVISLQFPGETGSLGRGLG